jgi:hypothetical protein
MPSELVPAPHLEGLRRPLHGTRLNIDGDGQEI